MERKKYTVKDFIADLSKVNQDLEIVATGEDRWLYDVNGLRVGLVWGGREYQEGVDVPTLEVVILR